jgi:thiol-disulfide isomerase/thioredoxin
MPDLSGVVAWLNSPPLSRDDLKGKVVLVDFWTYSCINCLRTLPYIRAWEEKYKGAGLVVLGVHTLDGDRLYFGVLLQAVFAELTADPRLLKPAERSPASNTS